jgi:hypothetical protein
MLLGLEPVIGANLEPFQTLTLLATAALLAGGCLFGLGGGVLAGFLLRNQLQDALDPENLRAA